MSTDRYLDAVATGPGAALAGRLGLPRPVALRRGGGALLPGPALVGAVGSGRAHPVAALAGVVRDLGGQVITDAPVAPGPTAGPGAGPGAGARAPRPGAVVLDARAVERVADLEDVRAVLAPAVRALAPGGRVLLLAHAPGEDPAQDASLAAAVERAAARQALDGLVRTVAKELRGGATANMLLLPAHIDNSNVLAASASSIAFVLSGRSAYVDGQVVTLGPAPGETPAVTERSLAGQVAVVTGAARGIGAAITAVLARAGAHVVGVDVPAAGRSLARTVNAVGGSALALDVTAPDAGSRLADHLIARHGGAHVLVHNAGITRDRLLVNLDPARWGSVLSVNLSAQLSLTTALLEAGALHQEGRIVAVSSTSGIAGNRGQANYAASKAGVIGSVRALAPLVAARGITVNAVAPGFIETELTASMPALTRQVARRVASLAQGGLPVDVAETVAWLAEPASATITGQVVRVCGQNVVGA